jgi:ABC-2 type transport system ATP-binding protein
VQAKRQLAYVPDDPRLFETLTVWEHLEFYAAAYDLRDWKPRAEKLLEEFELTPKRTTVGAELSRGMRQKTAACCAYLHEPKLLMMDEPMTGLDPRGIRTMKQSLAAAAASGTAVVISSHLLDVVEDLCDSVLIMHKGRALFDGPIHEARQAVAHDRPEGTADLSLEEVFFKLTEQSDLAPPTAPLTPSPLPTSHTPTEPRQ